jgi:hypothetical protein
MTETDAAYIAGIIDGEGCITVSRRNDPTCKQGFYLRPFLTTANTSREMLDFCHQKTGLGQIIYYRSKQVNHRNAWRWNVWTQQALSVLIIVSPYLITKKRQADLLIELATLQRGKYGRSGLPEGSLARRIKIELEIKQLNKRGVN